MNFRNIKSKMFPDIYSSSHLKRGFSAYPVLIHVGLSSALTDLGLSSVPEKRQIKQKFATLPLFFGDLPSWTFGIFLLDAGRRFAFAATFSSSSSSLYANSESCIHSGTGFCSCTFRVGCRFLAGSLLSFLRGDSSSGPKPASWSLLFMATRGAAGLSPCPSSRITYR